MSSGQGSNNGKSKQNSTNSTTITRAIRGLIDRISHAITIRQEPTAEENKQYAEERGNRESQLRTAKKLNYITAFSGFIALGALILVYLQYRQSRNAFEAGQRAWVLITNVPIVKAGTVISTNPESIPSTPIVAGETEYAPIFFKNSGNSPALNTRMQLQPLFFTGEKCYVQPFAESPYKSVGAIAPQSIATNSSIVFKTDQSCVDALNSGEASFVIRGTIFYSDIFSKSHRTIFCIQYEGKTTQEMTTCKDGDEPD